MQSAAVSTYMAINGDGFFAVQKPGSFTDNNPVFTGVNNYTRRGDFSLDKNGYLVNGAGYYLEGVPIDPTTGNPSGSAPEVLKFQNDFLPSQATTKIDYRANLASYPLTDQARRLGRRDRNCCARPTSAPIRRSPGPSRRRSATTRKIGTVA